jgi:hypothetical protein
MMHIQRRVAHVTIVAVATMSIFTAMGEAHILSIARAKRAAEHDAAIIAKIKPTDAAKYKVDRCRRLSNHRVNCRAFYRFRGAAACYQHTIRVTMADPPSTSVSNTYTVPVKVKCP